LSEQPKGPVRRTGSDKDGVIDVTPTPQEKEKAKRGYMDNISSGMEKMLEGNKMLLADVKDIREKQDNHDSKITAITDKMKLLIKEVNSHTEIINKGPVKTGDKVSNSSDSSSDSDDLLTKLVNRGIDYLDKKERGGGDSSTEGFFKKLEELRKFNDLMNPGSEIDSLIMSASKKGYWRFMAKQGGMTDSEIKAGEKVIDVEAGTSEDEHADREHKE